MKPVKFSGSNLICLYVPNYPKVITNYKPVCMLSIFAKRQPDIGEWPDRIIQSPVIEKINKLPLLLKWAINWWVINWWINHDTAIDYVLITPIRLQIIRNNIDSIGPVGITDDPKISYFTPFITKRSLSKVCSYKKLVGKAVSQVNKGQIYHNLRTDKIWYSNYFFLGEVLLNRSGYCLIPLVCLVVKDEFEGEYATQLLFDESVDMNNLELWINTDFIKYQYKDLYSFYRKIMYPEIKKSKVKVIFKKDILVEFNQVIRRPSFNNIIEVKETLKEQSSQFMNAIKIKHKQMLYQTALEFIYE